MHYLSACPKVLILWIIVRLLRNPSFSFLNASALGELISIHSKIKCLQTRLSLAQDLRCRSGSIVPEFVHKFQETLLVEMLGPNVSKLVLRLRVWDDDRAVLDRCWMNKNLRATWFARGEYDWCKGVCPFCFRLISCEPRRIEH